MRVITLVTRKGGTGKSTLSTGIAVAATRNRRSIVLAIIVFTASMTLPWLRPLVAPAAISLAQTVGW